MYYTFLSYPSYLLKGFEKCKDVNTCNEGYVLNCSFLTLYYKGPVPLSPCQSCLILSQANTCPETELFCRVI